MDLYLLGEGSDKNVYRKLGAHPKTARGHRGTRFAVWAPNASRVSVVGDFNGWDGRRHVMRLHPGNGIWEIFLPGVGNGALYKYEITDAQRQAAATESRPLRHLHEPPPGNSSIVFESDFDWQDDDWMSTRRTGPKLDAPDQHLRSSPRVLAPQGRRQLPELPGPRGRACRLRRRDGFHAHRVAARHRAPVRRILGLPADRHVCADAALRHARRFPLLSSTPATRSASASSWTGSPRTFPMTSTGFGNSTARPCMNMPILARERTPTGVR